MNMGVFCIFSVKVHALTDCIHVLARPVFVQRKQPRASCHKSHRYFIWNIREIAVLVKDIQKIAFLHHVFYRDRYAALV
ncbi:hypothetical protein CJU79_19185 [Pseudomonas fragi]|nr:hypothetical protein CJU79_19185 [Pseudomonas fragi]